MHTHMHTHMHTYSTCTHPQAGYIATLGMLAIGYTVAFTTILSISAIVTSVTVEGGGVYCIHSDIYRTKLMSTCLNFSVVLSLSLFSLEVGPFEVVDV